MGAKRKYAHYFQTGTLNSAPTHQENFQTGSYAGALSIVSNNCTEGEEIKGLDNSRVCANCHTL